MFAKIVIFMLRIVLYPVKFVPRKTELLLGRFLGFILYRIIRLRRNIVRENIKIAFPDWSLDNIKTFEKKNYTHYGQLCIELLHLPFDARRFSEKNVRVHDNDIVDKVFKKGKGVFFLTAHIGYWEIMSVVALLYKYPLNVITKYLRMEIFDRIWVKSRESYGIKLIDERFTAKYVLKSIKNNEGVGFVLDQFMGPPVGLKVDFFGRKAWTIASLAWFVQKTDAAVVPVYNYRNDDGSFDLYINPELDFENIGNSDENIKHNTQRYSKIIEGLIKARPEQWIWLHRRWKTCPEDFKEGIE